MPTDAPSERTQAHRLPERGIYDRDVIDAILDEALICHVGHIVDGHPVTVTGADAIVTTSSEALATWCPSRAGEPRLVRLSS